MKIIRESNNIDLSSEEGRNLIGISDLTNTIINRTYDLISDLNSLRITLQDFELEDLIEVVNSIVEEENNHIGKLQHITEVISPEASNIEDGKEEASEMISEGLRNAKNIKRHRKALREEENDVKYYASHYKEEVIPSEDGSDTPISKLVDYEEFSSLTEAKEYLKDLASKEIENGFERKSNILLVKPSKYVGDDEYYLIEDELGSEENQAQ